MHIDANTVKGDSIVASRSPRAKALKPQHTPMCFGGGLGAALLVSGMFRATSACVTRTPWECTAWIW